MHLALLDAVFIGRSLALVQAGNGVRHAVTGHVQHASARAVPVMADTLFTARDVQKLGVQGLVPDPIESVLGKGLVKGLAVGRLGIGQSAIYVKNQGLQHGHPPVLGKF